MYKNCIKIIQVINNLNIYHLYQILTYFPTSAKKARSSQIVSTRCKRKERGGGMRQLLLCRQKRKCTFSSPQLWINTRMNKSFSEPTMVLTFFRSTTQTFDTLFSSKFMGIEQRIKNAMAPNALSPANYRITSDCMLDMIQTEAWLQHRDMLGNVSVSRRCKHYKK